MAAVIKMFGHLKKYPKRGIVIDSTEPTHINNMEVIKPDYGNQYCEFNEELDDKFPEPLMKEIGSTIFVDSNHGHDKVTGKSITGIVSLLGSTPANWYAKRQSSCLTSTFGAEFISLKKAVEEAVALRCYCRSFGMKVTRPTITHEDNMSVVMNCTNPGSKLSHKSMALSHHFVREHSYGEVVEIRKVASNDNTSDVMTKGLDSASFNNCMLPIMVN